jgi:hypothetical protein
MPIVQLMIERGANDWNGGLLGSAERGHMNILLLMIDRGANDWNLGMAAASHGGHVHIVQSMIERGANNWNAGMLAAARCGHMPIVLLMIEKGADDWSKHAVTLLKAHPAEVIYLSRCGHVAQHLFAKHSPLFEQWIREDEQIRVKARDLLLPSVSGDDTILPPLPRELCELILSY